MPNVLHSALTGAELHEPKGAASASLGQLYFANGLGSGVWKKIVHGAWNYFAVGTGTTFTTPTTYTLVNVASTGETNPSDVSHNNAGRLTYTGTPSVDGNMICTVCFKHSTGSGNDVYFAIYKNGVATGVEFVQAANSTNYTTVTFNAHFNSVATNDYFEVYVKTASGSVTIHSMSVTAHGYQV